MYTKPNQLLSVESIFCIIVIAISLLNISKFPGILSILVSFIGIVGGISFFTGKEFYIKLIYAWIIVQVIAFRPLFDFTQFFNFGFSFIIQTSEIDYELYINIIAIIYLGSYKFLVAASTLNKKVIFEEFRESELGNIFPLTGKICDNIQVGDEFHWTLVTLEDNFNYEGHTIGKVLVRRKEGGLLKLNKKQLIYFKLVLNDNDLTDTTDKTKFPFIEWVYCR